MQVCVRRRSLLPSCGVPTVNITAVIKLVIQSQLSLVIIIISSSSSSSSSNNRR